MGPKRVGGGSNRGRSQVSGGSKREQRQRPRPQPQPQSQSQPPPSQAGRSRVVSECSEDHCPVCLSRMSVFAAGHCNHHICMECSTRLRVLCQQNECPICRQDLPSVVFSRSRIPYESKPLEMDRRRGICFEDEGVRQVYNELLEHKCPECPNLAAFPTFTELGRHVKREHQLFFCTLCIEHLKIFTRERRLYNRSDLATHRRKGDPDDTSHRGHPLCEFCEQRFVDKDELYTHLRRDHYYCHFCDADGQQHIFFPGYDELRDHFGEDHFLCSEGNCANEEFTSAFRTEIDLKAHLAERHGNQLSKAAAKQNRIVDVELTYTRPVRDQHSRRRGRKASPEAEVHHDGSQVQDRSERVMDLSDESFPSLGHASVVGAGVSAGQSDNLARRMGSQPVLNTRWSNGHRYPAEEDFPSLPGASSLNNVVSASSAPVNGARKKQPQLKGKKVARDPMEDFPSLGDPAKNLSSLYQVPQSQTAASWTKAAAPKVSAQVGNPRPEVTVKKKEGMMTTLKKQERQQRPPTMVDEDDFPGLEAVSKGNDTSKSSGVTKKNQKKSQKKRPSSSIKEEIEEHQQKSTTLKSERNPTLADKLVSGSTTNRDSLSVTSEGIGLNVVNEVNKSGDTDDNEWQEIKPAKPSKGLASAMPEQSVSLNRPSIPGLSFSQGSSNRAAGMINLPKELPKTQVIKNNEEDFPSLAPSTKMNVHFRPALAKGETRANDREGSAWSVSVRSKTSTSHPPGFAPSAVKAPPPGFKAKVQRSKKEKIPAIYQQSPDFSARNSKLLSTVVEMLGGKSLEFSQFKTASGQFRRGEMNSQDYYQQCLNILDERCFLKILPELIVLLPDINKQQEFLAVHLSTFPASKLPIRRCSICSQVLGNDDKDWHADSHFMDNDFPLLS